jgi:glycosyltransferase involved in cell wall biosynthesis
LRLLVVSHTPHAFDAGEWKGWSATVRELSALAVLFDDLVHVAPTVEGADAGMCAYSARNVTVVGVKPSGGEGLAAKAGILMAWFDYARVILREMRKADAVHVRCPCNIGLLAVLLLCFVREPRRRWIKYAGNWRPEGREAWSYRVQRWLLRRSWHGGVVTVNGQWAGDPPHVREFFNPSFSEAELEDARAWGRKKTLNGVVRCVFVGRVEEAKGAGRAVEIVRRLREQGVGAELDIVGDGPLRVKPSSRGEAWVRFHGWLPRQELGRVWREAHVTLLPSETEGWPKVLSEGMAWGAVPVASNVGCIPQYLERFGCGTAVHVEDLNGFMEAVRRYMCQPDRWKAESCCGIEAAGLFTYEAHVRRVEEVMGC